MDIMKRKRERKVAQCKFLTCPSTRIDESRGVRFVDQYEFLFETYVKGRWVGKPFLKFCVSEFGSEDPDKALEYYSRAITSGKCAIDHETTDPHYVLRDNDVLSHTTLVDEPVIPWPAYSVVHETERFLVINKSCGVPIHPSGGYRVNTLEHIMLADYAPRKVYFPHRLDRHTSGLMLVGLNREWTAQVSRVLTEPDQHQKVYLARVKGFLIAPRTVKGYMQCVDPKKGVHALVESGCKTEKSLSTEEERCSHDNALRFSETAVVPLALDRKTGETVVKCFPRTGRTHQIRVHLSSIGHPISNDECYCGTYDPSHPFAMNRVPYTDRPGDHTSGIFLHSLQYTIESMGLSFSTEPPRWASVDELERVSCPSDNS